MTDTSAQAKQKKSQKILEAVQLDLSKEQEKFAQARYNILNKNLDHILTLSTYEKINFIYRIFEDDTVVQEATFGSRPAIINCYLSLRNEFDANTLVMFCKKIPGFFAEFYNKKSVTLHVKTLYENYSVKPGGIQ